MRSLVLALLVLPLLSCDGPKCVCGFPSLLIVATANGEPIVASDRDTVLLAPVVRGCATKTQLILRNQGNAPASVTISSSSPDIVVLQAPSMVSSFTESNLELLLTRTTSAFVATDLTIEVEGQPTQQFRLRADVVDPDPTLPRELDFGGVEVGVTVSLPEYKLSGLTGDFEMGAFAPTFSPRSLGYQEVRATYASMLECPELNQVLVRGDGVTSVLTGPAEVDFGDVPVGTTAVRDVTLLNHTFRAVSAQFSRHGVDFKVVTSPPGELATRDSAGALVPGANTLRIEFTPTATGPALQELAATVGSRTVLIPFRGNGTP